MRWHNFRQSAEILTKYCRRVDELTIHFVHASHKGKQQQTTKGEAMKTMDHAGYAKRCRKMTDAELRFTISDARQAAENGKDWDANVGYYLDEIHYCSMELSRRQKRAK